APAVVDMAFGPEPRKIAGAAASNAAGRPLKVAVTSGGTGNGAAKPRPASSAGNSQGRNRALEDPVVRRMQDKFGAEIRTIIDHREKR
ncbi:MAG TPA: hypothetical protein VJP83_14395, partial [Terriglobales bacterium]|nr:hypothetical protein [Terriglobales bacterium]